MKPINFFMILAFIMLYSFNLKAQKIKGVWQGVKYEYNSKDTSHSGSTQPNLFIFSDNYYSIQRITAQKERPKMPEKTKFVDIPLKILKETIGSYMANSGTYEMKGNVLTYKPIVALYPNYMMSNPVETYEVKIEKDKMILFYGKKMKNGKYPGKVYFKRLE